MEWTGGLKPWRPRNKEVNGGEVMDTMNKTISYSGPVNFTTCKCPAPILYGKCLKCGLPFNTEEITQLRQLLKEAGEKLIQARDALDCLCACQCTCGTTPMLCPICREPINTELYPSQCPVCTAQTVGVNIDDFLSHPKIKKIMEEK